MFLTSIGDPDYSLCLMERIDFLACGQQNLPSAEKKISISLQ